MSDGDLRQPLSTDAPSIVKEEYIDKSNVEAVINLQMDYLLVKKSILTKKLFFSKFSLSLLITTLSILTHLKLSNYYSIYNFPNNETFFNSFLKLLKNNSFFREDLISLILQSLFSISILFVCLWFKTNYLKFQSDDVPLNLKKYFGEEINLELYKSNESNSKHLKQLKQLNKLLVENSRVIYYRNTPIAFISKTPTSSTISTSTDTTKKAEEKENHLNTSTSTSTSTNTTSETGEEAGSFDITGLGIRRVYIKSGILNELIQSFQKDPKVKKLNINVYSFEEYDCKILIENNFKLVRQVKNNDFILGSIFGVNDNTFSWVR